MPEERIYRTHCPGCGSHVEVVAETEGRVTIGFVLCFDAKEGEAIPEGDVRSECLPSGVHARIYAQASR